MFFGEFCEISQNTFFTEYFWTTAFVVHKWRAYGFNKKRLLPEVQKCVIKPADGKKSQLLFININHFAFIRIATLYNDGDDETTKTLLRSTDLDMISR